MGDWVKRELRYSRIVILGRFLSPYSIKGWLNVEPWGDECTSWKKIKTWHILYFESLKSYRHFGSGSGVSARFQELSSQTELWHPLFVESILASSNKIRFKIKDIDDRAAAEIYSGALFGATRDSLPKLGHDELYLDDLVGLLIKNHRHEILGRVKSVMPSPAHPILVLEGKGTCVKSSLIPYTAPIVQSVSLDAGEIVVEWEQEWLD